MDDIESLIDSFKLHCDWFRETELEQEKDLQDNINTRRDENYYAEQYLGILVQYLEECQGEVM